MLINGEKWACEACVRGHRVSNCQHADRPLQHINKKGRPVSQCQHCRSLRKSRSAHSKCDCVEKNHSKTACPHLKEGDSKADQCCCSHGGRCSCALKKEHLDPVPESDSDKESGLSLDKNSRRARAHTVHSDGSMTIFTANGHHKPAHKHNKMAQKCGMPYVIPRNHSIHGPTPAGLANRSVDNLPHTNTIDALHSESLIKDSMVSAQQEQRMVKSEHGSPLLMGTANCEQLNGQLPPLDLSGLSNDYSLMQNYDVSSAVDDQPIFSAGLSAASIDWSLYDGLDFNNDSSFGPSSFRQPPSYSGGFEYNGSDQPALTTTSTSGEVSEVEDFMANEPGSIPSAAIKYGSDFDTSERDAFRNSTSSSYVGLQQAQLLANNEVNSFSMEEFLKGVSANGSVSAMDPSADGLSAFLLQDDSKFLPSASMEESSFTTFPADENESFWMNSFTNDNASTFLTEETAEDTKFWEQ